MLQVLVGSDVINAIDTANLRIKPSSERYSVLSTKWHSHLSHGRHVFLQLTRLEIINSHVVNHQIAPLFQIKGQNLQVLPSHAPPEANRLPPVLTDV